MNAAGLDRTRVSIRIGPLVGPVLARLVGIHGARAPLGVDELQDALTVTDTLAAHVPAFVLGESIPVSLKAGDGRLELRVGPLRAGATDALLSDPGPPGSENALTRLADVRVREGRDGTEYLVVAIGAEPAA